MYERCLLPAPQSVLQIRRAHALPAVVDGLPGARRKAWSVPQVLQRTRAMVFATMANTVCASNILHLPQKLSTSPPTRVVTHASLEQGFGPPCEEDCTL